MLGRHSDAGVAQRPGSPDPRARSAFGDLRYLRDARFWEGKVAFAPAGRDVEVLISGPATGPTGEQRAFLAELERRYHVLWRTIKDRLVAEASNTAADGHLEFELVGLDIPETPGPDAEWELAYEARPPSGHFTVSLRGWEPGDVVGEC